MVGAVLKEKAKIYERLIESPKVCGQNPGDLH